jgi:hypothetical protein
MARDVRLDTVRGLLLVMMTLNHFGFLLPEGWWGHHLTWQPLGYVSAAEGFVFLAGFTASSVFARYAGNLTILQTKARESARRLCAYHLGVSLSLAALFWLLPLYHTAWAEWFSPSPETPFASALAITLLLHQPPLLDVLPMYAIFVFLSPWAVALLHRRQYRMLFLTSATLWLLGQFVHPLEWVATLLFPDHRPGYFNVFSWQLLYVLGLALGDTQCRTVAARFVRRPALLGLVIVCVLLLFLSRHAVLLPEITAGIDRSSLQWVRLTNCLCLVTLASYAFSGMPSRVHVPWLTFLGQHSLPVFSFHVAAFYVLLPFSWYVAVTYSLTGFVPYVMLLTVCLWGVAFLHRRYQDVGLPAGHRTPTLPDRSRATYSVS